MSERPKVARLDLSTTDPSPDAVPTSFSEAPSKQTKRLHQLKPSAKIDLTTHGPVRKEAPAAKQALPKPKAAKPTNRRSGGDRPSGSHRGQSKGSRRGGDRSQGAPSSGSTLADLLSADVLAKLRGE